MKAGQFLVQTDCPILIGFLALCSVSASAAVFALVVFVFPSIVVARDSFAVKEMKGFSIRTDEIPSFVTLEIDWTEWILTIPFVFCFFLVHREFHIFFKNMVY